jgi:hypothetical protein
MVGGRWCQEVEEVGGRPLRPVQFKTGGCFEALLEKFYFY